jgi:putative N6-adenine-specific DNA methylase
MTADERIFAVTTPGLEAVTARELAALGIDASVEAGGLSWEGPPASLQQANLHLRTASRVLLRIGEFRARTFFELERHARRLPWSRFLSPERPARLRVTCRKSRLYHQGAVAQRLLAAIAEITGAGGHAAHAPAEEDDDGEGQLFVVRFLRDQCTVSADTSGAHLHRRGYRPATGPAPLRETLAAAMLLAAGFDGTAPLLDPLCGAGTIAIEAALLARRIPPGLALEPRTPRDFAFLHWPECDTAAWQRIVENARDAILPRAPAPILASDASGGAIRIARANARRAGVEADIAFAVCPLDRLPPQPAPSSVITNPPYGLRIGDRTALRRLQRDLEQAARSSLAHATLAVLTADTRDALRPGEPARDILHTRNGGIPVTLWLRPAP